MKTKILIKETSRGLFNERGIMNVTLRDVAAQMNKSYGNITYHFPTKESLLQALFDDLHTALVAFQAPTPDTNLMAYILSLPGPNFDVTIRYLFLTVDLVEIKRNYPAFFSRVSTFRNSRKVKWFQLLSLLRQQGYFNSHVQDKDLEYIMFLSGSVRTAYFQTTEPDRYKRSDFIQLVNRFLKPYLSASGIAEYDKGDFAQAISL